ncbi:MAG TPA: hypothetical protein PK191_08435 [Niabella sp.]|nr:hypothetical protein [Niabella sp.]HQW13881.1 hypothetical protein [Niabella sp.]HQX19226.1 hypothetical protein [Niabella sp.]HQX41055.1 hypothetical protein [Niabella sp.]HRB06220.1 hypothetical protein [Niabella sp.]
MKNLHLSIVLVYLTVLFFSCKKEHTNAEENEIAEVQSQDADTLYFTNETQFRDFLVTHNLAENYAITPPKYSFDCTNLPASTSYPDMHSDDYLNEEDFIGKPFVILFDHIITRKHLNIFFPTYYEENPQAPHNLNFCNVYDYVTNRATGQVACFINSFNWFDERGENMLNFNKKLWLLWGYSNGNITFGITRIHKPTGVDLTFKEYFPDHSELTLSFSGIESKYGYLK